MENKVITVKFGSKTKNTSASNLMTTESTGSVGATAHDLNHNEEPLKEEFRSLADRNRANQERLRKERALANKAVLKSYKIK